MGPKPASFQKINYWIFGIIGNVEPLRVKRGKFSQKVKTT